MEWVGYEYAYMFKYSERPGTQAARQFKDDVPEEVKGRRLTESSTCRQNFLIKAT